jgi:DNA invertase Pin-like site-specific DNA recombinase
MGRAPYTRLSSDYGKVSESTVNQRFELEEYFERQGWPWDESLYFTDNDLSASKYATKPRPGYLDLLVAIRAGRVELILVTEVSRLFRNLADAVELLNLVRSTSLRWVETSTGGARYDLTTVQGEHNLLEAVVGASRESGNTSDRVRRGKRANARAGYWPGGARPYGYKRVPVVNEDGVIVPGRITLEPIPAEVAVVDEIRARVLAGEGLSRIAMDLSERGIPSAKGKRWHRSTVRQLLEAPALRGVRSHHGTEYPATWPAIISPEDWKRIQVLLSNEARHLGDASKGVRSYLLTGFAECGVTVAEGRLCGAVLRGARTKAGAETAYRRRYRCEKDNNYGAVVGCGALVRLADPVELAVSEAVFARYEGEDLAELVAPDAPEELHELAASLSEDGRRLEQASRDRYRRKGDPLRLEEGQFLTIQAEIKEAMEMTKRRMARLEQGRALAEIPVGMTLRQAWDAADLGWRRTILSLVVAKIILYPSAPGRREWPDVDSPLLNRAVSLGGPWNFDPSRIDIQWKL